jgi:hypothetical protein
MAEESLAAALLAVQKRDIRVVKDAKANYGRYATLGNVIDALRPALNEEALVVTQFPSHISGAGTPALTTEVVFAPTGESVSYTAALVIDRDNMQGMGSALTYARRYALVGIFLLDADEDDDAQSTVKPVSKEEEDLEDAKAHLVATLEARGMELPDGTPAQVRKAIRDYTGLTAKELNDGAAIRAWLAALV